MVRDDSMGSSPPLPPVLVLDGAQRAALAVVRSLGGRGVTVHVGSTQPRSPTGGSRFAASESVLPDPLRNPGAFPQAVADVAAARGAEVIMPITEASHLALLGHRGGLPKVLLPCGDSSAFSRATDKVLVRQVAKEEGLEVPEEWQFVPGVERPKVPAECFPLVLKPRRSVHEAQGVRRQASATYVNSPDALVPVLESAERAGIELIGQRRVLGPGLGVFLLRWNGQILATFAHRRIREKPPSGGVSVCCESVWPPDALVSQSSRLLHRLDWNGVAMVEFKHDLATGRDVLLEVNPRFWGSLQLAIDTGIDFPWLLLQAVLGRPEQGPARWPAGVRSRWLLGELDHLIGLATKSRRRLDLPPGSPGLLRTLLANMQPGRGPQRFDVARWSDPRPAWRELADWVRAGLHWGAA